MAATYFLKQGFNFRRNNYIITTDQVSICREIQERTNGQLQRKLRSQQVRQKLKHRQGIAMAQRTQQTDSKCMGWVFLPRSTDSRIKMITSKAIIVNKTSLWANKKSNNAVIKLSPNSCKANPKLLSRCRQAVAKPLIIKQFQAGNFHRAVFNIVKRSLSCLGTVVRLSETSTSATTSTSFE